MKKQKLFYNTPPKILLMNETEEEIKETEEWIRQRIKKDYELFVEYLPKDSKEWKFYKMRLDTWKDE